MTALSGRTALVTGSSRGIGQQIALGLAKNGCDIIIHARKKTNLVKTRTLLANIPVQVYEVEGALDVESDVLQLIKAIKSLNTEVDILYNNAGMMEDFNSDYLSHNWETWNKTFQVNVFALYSLCSAFLPKMLEQNFGRIINLTSGITGTPELAPYSASKWAVRKITEDLASKVNDNQDVRIFSLDPGWLQTDMGGPNAPNNVIQVLPGAILTVISAERFENGSVVQALDFSD